MEEGTVQVLLIEDDEEDYIITRHLLSASKERTFALTWAANLESGLKGIDGKVDAILLDLSLPDSQGWETFLRTRGRAAGIPVILLTGLDDESLGIRAVHEGAEDYLVKGQLEGRLLCRSILYAIERRKIRDRLEQVAGELRSCNIQMESDLGMAREVQQALMPRQYPAVRSAGAARRDALRFGHIYRPCRTVGGDFYHVAAVSPGVAGLFISDVMGHGMRSALVTAMLRAFLEELKPVAADPGRLLTEVNRALTAVLRQPHQLIFTTAVYLVVDLSASRISGASAGHPDPFVARQRSGAVEDLHFEGEALGPALGIDGTRSYGIAHWTLEPEDKIVLFTDGVCEATDVAGAEYGRERLLQVVRENVKQPIDGLLAAVMANAEAFVGQAKIEDDMCLLGAEMFRSD